MKISSLSNANLVIQARNEKDYQAALKVAEAIETNSNREFVSCSADEIALRVHVSARWCWGQAEELKEAYSNAKKGLCRGITKKVSI